RHGLGQNFLSDQNMARALCTSLNADSGDIVVEYCAGAGAMTKILVGTVARIYAVEIDERMVGFLEDISADAATGITEVSVVHADARKFDLSTAGNRVRVLGNLAYNVSVPLLMCCLHQYRCIADIHVMLQKEVAERLCARPNSKDYGRLAAVMQTWFDIRILRRVPPECFTPRPAVNSAFVRLQARAEPALSHDCCHDFERFIRRIFAMRRKSLYNNLRPHYSADQLERLSGQGISTRARAQELTVSALNKLFNCMEDDSCGENISHR
ncbi:MAG: 16S rRNA (adenine(1518)-N(6)/adenine(1519)-N(6))-dimethyltransferase RsmA, partial [Proteobacteria bacterium]|nr:16S rRNA (adenine(1518)-N(6)/adenine(1519)-N(6))-dimethyltransferase RsmA [Pseudomonadota bacterium]